MIRRIVLWIKGNPSLNADEAREEFRKRHKHGVFFFLIPMILFSVFVIFPKGNLLSEETLVSLAFTAFFVLFFYTMLYYRCPRCGTTPTSSKPGTTGVLLFPKKCSRCGAPLLPNHRWGQD
ncbi:hypothetical protein [Rhodoferax aquaticus]|uniref:Uncharacterized protein n=1 Tax=Rhodoferax aquaticus TaxID=2527691 RepID=A0A515ERR7_9BURK|nr:hypothetical protein [Rhodoferax aquaticus]QDL55361.1 hypothetical protein EXZ61_14930 [Rhodoferax aquaticus]